MGFQRHTSIPTFPARETDGEGFELEVPLKLI